ncbi:MAG: glycosyl transferase [Chloroflexota bacterium]|nr:MAG: glycosyl transferase [Chloroflexota bacterium]
MATIVCFNIPAHGHIYPTLPVVGELVRRGERVIYYAMAPFGETIEAGGARFHDYEDLSPSMRFDFGGDDRRSASLPKLALAMIGFCEKSLPFLLEATRRDAPDLIMHDMTCFWGKYVAQILEIPAVAAIPQFPFNRKRRPEAYPGMYADLARMILTGIPALVQFRRIAGRISRRYSVERLGFMDLLANHEELNIVFTSREFQPHAADFDERFAFVGPSIADRDEKLGFSLDFGRGSLVYISLGTIFGLSQAFYRLCCQAFSGDDKRVLVSAGQGVDLGELEPFPDNFLVRRYVPQLEVLKRADVFITHGGMNSVGESLWYGVPLVVIPQGSDQYLVARRVEKLGLGAVLDKRSITPQALRQAADLVMADVTIDENIKRIQDSFRQAGGYQRAADLIQGIQHQS